MISKQTFEKTHSIRVTLRVVVFFAFWLPIFTSEAAACFCGGGGTPCEDYWKALVVFAGAVTGSSQVTLVDGDS